MVSLDQLNRKVLVGVVLSVLALGLVFTPTLMGALSQDENVKRTVELKASPEMVFDDDAQPLDTYEEYGIWAFVNYQGVWWNSRVTISMYVQCDFRQEKYNDGTLLSTDYFTEAAPWGLVKWGADYQFRKEIPNDWNWTSELGEEWGNYETNISDDALNGLLASCYCENDDYGSVDGDWRYMGWWKYEIGPTLGPADIATALVIKLHVIDEVGRDYYGGHSHTDGTYDYLTYVEGVRIKVVVEFNNTKGGGEMQTHVIGDNNPSDTDLDAIPLVNGTKV